MRTYICDSGSGVAAVTIAVDRETADASRGLKWLRETVTYTCVPYVYNWSQDVEKCTLDLVLSSSTRTNTVQATAVASKPRRKSLQDPLLQGRQRQRHAKSYCHPGSVILDVGGRWRQRRR